MMGEILGRDRWIRTNNTDIDWNVRRMNVNFDQNWKIDEW